MASLFTSTPTRPLVLHSTSARVSLPVPASPLSAWVASEVLAQDFHDSRAGLDDDIVQPVDEDEDAVVEPTNEPQVKLLARFLSFAAGKVTSASSNSDLAQVLLAAYDRFNELFLGSTNIQSLVEAYEPEIRAEVLQAYYKAFAAARAALGESKVKVANTSALLQASKDGKAEIYALFGGQGVNEVSPVFALCQNQAKRS